MTADKTTFDLRFSLIEKLQPSIDGLKIFLYVLTAAEAVLVMSARRVVRSGLTIGI